MVFKAPKLQDVADAAGVSTATVSRCLNQPEKVVEHTRNRVLKAVQDLGYAPNFNARSLAAGQSQTIGAIIPTMENAIFAEGMQAFQEKLQAAGYTLLIASSSYDAAIEADEIRTLVARGADALLLIGFDRDPTLYRFLETQAVPVLVAWTHDPNAELPSIGFDNRAAMATLVKHAIDLGHRKIGMISARVSTNDRARARVEGARAAMSDAGLPELIVEETDYGIAEGAAAFDRLLSRDPDLSLVLCGNDVLAAGAIQAAAASGIAVPQDISITGFDDISLAQLVTPGLTTVRVPHRAMGDAAAKALIGMLNGEDPQGRLLPTELCLRASLAAPKGA